MIIRIWHGYAAPENANAYETITKNETFANIRKRNIPGFQEIQLYRRDGSMEVEFITIMWFDSLESVRAYAGENYEKAVVLPRTQAYLSRFDEITRHYEVVTQVTRSE
jgi:heme-degrading monooxygenase HmoA